MNNDHPPYSVYQVSLDDLSPRGKEALTTSVPPQIAAAKESRQPWVASQPAPPVDQTAHRITLDHLRKRNEEEREQARSGRAAPSAPPARVPLTERLRKTSIPARDRQHRKTVAFGVTTNVSQTVERAKTPEMNRGKEMLAMGGENRTTTGRVAGMPFRSRNVVHTAEPMMDDQKENHDEDRDKEERSQKQTIEDLLAVISELKSRISTLEERADRNERHARSARHEFDRLVEVVAMHLETRDDRRPRSPPRRSSRSPCRRLDGLEKDRSRARDVVERRAEKYVRGTTQRSPSPVILDSTILPMLEKQMTTNPTLRRTIADALGKEQVFVREVQNPPRITESPDNEIRRERRRDVPRSPSPEPYSRFESPVGRRSVHGGGARMAAGGNSRPVLTPRRGYTERFVMERVHHFDGNFDDDDGPEFVDMPPGAGRRRGHSTRRDYDVDDEQEEEIIEYHRSMAQPDNFDPRSTVPVVRHLVDKGARPAKGGIKIQEVTNEEERRDRMEHRLAEIRERRKAREADGGKRRGE